MASTTTLFCLKCMSQEGDTSISLTKNSQNPIGKRFLGNNIKDKYSWNLEHWVNFYFCLHSKTPPGPLANTPLYKALFAKKKVLFVKVLAIRSQIMFTDLPNEGGLWLFFCHTSQTYFTPFFLFSHNINTTIFLSLSLSHRFTLCF